MILSFNRSSEVSSFVKLYVFRREFRLSSRFRHFTREFHISPVVDFRFLLSPLRTTVTPNKYHTPPPHAPQQLKTKYGNDFPLHTVYLFNLYYAQLHFNRLFFIAQHNNLNAQEQITIRHDLKYAGADITMVRGSVLNAVIRQSVIYQNLAPLVVGPTAMITSNVPEHENPSLVADILNIINKQKKLLLMGGMVDASVLNVEDIEWMAKLPSKKQLQAEMVSVLNSPAAMIVEILNRNPQSLIRSLELHKANLDKTTS